MEENIMSKNLTVSCEMCGELLRGKKGIEWVEKEHLALKGSFSQQLIDEYGQPDHYFITQDPDQPHHFCDWNCLRGFAQYREKRYQSIQADRRRREAQEETN